MTNKVSTRDEGAAATGERSADEIAEKISAAVLEHRLAPGAKLGEDRLATIFRSSRATVRDALERLVRDRFVELIPQRGSFVAKPTIAQSNEVFKARRLIEPGVLRRLIANLDDARELRLRRHLDLEADARRRDDKGAIVRLSGEFHVLLAELAGNPSLARSMRELTTLTCLIISSYDAPTATSCRADEHEEIVDAVKQRDMNLAERLMMHHLDHIKQSVTFDVGPEEANLESIFG